jgi:hypothetical protein
LFPSDGNSRIAPRYGVFVRRSRCIWNRLSAVPPSCTTVLVSFISPFGDGMLTDCSLTTWYSAAPAPNPVNRQTPAAIRQ